VLYSVGPDGFDDGGRPIVNRTLAGAPMTGRAASFTNIDSKGDIVAGVDIY
jgi:hypothetical protein